MKDADIVVANGAGYDNWLTDNVEEDTPLVTAQPLAAAHHHHGEDHGADEHAHEHEGHEHGEDANAEHEGHDHGDEHAHEHSHDETNPHVWFDLDVVSEFEKKLSTELHKLNSGIPESDEDITKKTDELKARVEKLSGKNVILTESVAAELVDDSDLKDVTPEGFTHACLLYTSPSPRDRG